MDYERIVIIGKGGSGKDYLRKKLVQDGFRYCVSHTSRPIREGEIDGDDYYFVSEEYFYLVPFYEEVVFNTWHYGTSIEEFNNSNLFIMTPSGLSKMSPSDRKQSYVIYIDIDEDIRKERLSGRRDADDVERRLRADEMDFENFYDFDHIITNPNFGLEELEVIKKRTDG
jgi:guanylate kinase